MTFDGDDDVLEAEIENMESARGPRSSQSIEGSPPLADEDRRFGPAEYDQHQQGGPSKSKLLGHDGSSSIAPRDDRHRRDVTTSAVPSASSGSTASLGFTVFGAQIQASIRVVTEVTFEHVDTNENVRVSAY